MIYILTVILIIILAVFDHQKTLKGIKIGLKKLIKNTPVFLNMIILVAISLHYVSDDLILKYLGRGSGIIGMAISSILGSLSLMPGFVAFPLAGVLLSKGVNYTVIAAFTTTLMMVGIVTYPIEKEYFGIRITIVRNLLGFFIAIIVSLLIGIFYKELIF
ncbi:MAG: permease [Bacillota bacterium]